MSYHGRVKLHKLNHPEKYLGKSDNINFDSLWERKFIIFIDNNPSILKWNREPVIPYLKPTTNKIHKYYVDFFIQLREKDGTIISHLIEIKPYNQTKEPKVTLTKKTKKPTKAYYKRLTTYRINKAKWQAAEKICEENGWKFTILHEKNSNFLGK